MNAIRLNSRAAILVAAWTLTVGVAGARGDLQVFCSNGFRGAMEALRTDAERAIAQTIVVRYGTSVSLRQAVADGQPFDLIIATDEGLESLVGEARVARESVRRLARVNLGVGMRAGQPVTDIGTPEAMKRRLLAARSVTYTKDGASNPAILRMVDKLGIADEIARKTVLQTVSGRPAESVGEGINELVLAPVSELRLVSGVQLLGLFPAEFQQPLVMTAGVSTKAAARDAAQALIAFLTSAAAAPTLRATGMDP